MTLAIRNPIRMSRALVLLFPLFIHTVVAQDKSILQTLQSGNPDDQIAVLAELSEADDRGAEYVAALAPLLSGKNKDVANLAAEVLGWIGPKAMPAAPALVDNMDDLVALTSDREQVWITFSRALSGIGPDVVPYLIERLPEANLAQYLGICAALHDLGDAAAPAVPALIAKAEGRDNTMVWSALYAMEHVGAAAEPAMPMILDALNNDDFQMPLIACRVIASLGPKAKDAKARLYELAGSEVPSTCSRAAIALGAVGFTDGDDEQLLGVLVKLLHNPNQVVRERAVQGIGKLGKAAAPIVEEVRNAAMNPQFAGRSQACLSLWRITGDAKEPLEILIRLFDSLDHDLYAIAAVGEMGSDAAGAVPALLAAIDNEDESYAIEVLKSLAKIGPGAKDALPKLRELSSHFDREIRTLAKQAIRTIEPPAVP